MKKQNFKKKEKLVNLPKKQMLIVRGGTEDEGQTLPPIK